jgi:antibiotic biosynthesis monooxygenase (ABM) superfamily enzyme
MKFKMKLIGALKIWIVIYPSITLFLYFLGEPLSAIPLYLRTLLLTVILVPWMIFVGLPILEKIRSAFLKNPVKLKG